MWNGERIPLHQIPEWDFTDFKRISLESYQKGNRIAGFWAIPAKTGYTLFQAWIDSSRFTLDIHQCRIGSTYPSLTPELPAVHLFERDIAERFRIVPEGHPWLKPVRFYRGTDARVDFFQMKGEEIHEVAVGPVHAGVIEPGHFRFQCNGETVYHLEISLGYQHRGIERALSGGPNARSIHYIETAAGDTSIGHGTAYALLIEALSGSGSTERADGIRAIALELERLANHIGDLGAMAGDIGFLPTHSYCGRIRGDALNLTALLCGNRFGRGLIRPGGVAYDIEDSRMETLLQGLRLLEKDATSAIELLFDTPSVMSRFEGTGALQAETAREIGLVGLAARACGLSLDVRTDLPSSVYKRICPNVCTATAGDCYARAFVRWLEIQESIRLIRQLAESLPNGEIQEEKALKGTFTLLEPESLGIGITEGWRGEIFHVAATDSTGKFAWYRIVDPSFHNWFGLALALRGQQISDFPLCNKSFNLSYCGHDL
ncbi:MAG TPA: hypothetical protein PLG79_02495 [Spirochaetales bacterium]|nr:hypothetical protein [Spirochaetales bacterium]